MVVLIHYLHYHIHQQILNVSFFCAFFFRFWSGLCYPLVAQRISICLQCRRPGIDPWVGKIRWRRKWQSTPVLLPGKSHGQRSLTGYSSWGRKEWDTTEWLHFHFHAILSFPGGTVAKNPPASAAGPRSAGSVPGLEGSPGEGNGDPLQYSCLGNSTARGAWWATIHVGRKESVTAKRLTHTYYPHKVHWEAFHLSLYFQRV